MASNLTSDVLDNMPNPNTDNTSLDRDTLIRLTVEIEKLVEEVSEMRKDYRTQQAINTTTAVLNERVNRLENIVYGCAGAIATQAVGLIGLVLHIF